MTETIHGLRLLFSIDRDLKEPESAREAAALGKQRSLVSSRIPAPILSGYEALMRAGRIPPVVEAPGSHCGGCNLRLTPRFVSEIRRGQRLLACPHCGRLLFFPAPSVAAPAPVRRRARPRSVRSGRAQRSLPRRNDSA